MIQFTSAQQMRIIWFVVVPVMSLPVFGLALVVLAIVAAVVG